MLKVKEQLTTIIDNLDDDLVAWTEKWKVIDLRNKAIILLNSVDEQSKEEVIEFVSITNNVISEIKKGA